MSNTNNKTSEQNKGIRNTILAVCLFIAGVLALFIHGINKPQILAKQELRNNGSFLFDKARNLADFSLITHENKPFDKTNLQGRWSLIFFGFTYCPDVCPTTLAQLKQFYEKNLSAEQQKKIQVILVSVDPARDSPEKLFDYIRYFNETFLALTGDFFAIHRFATQLNTPFAKVPGGGENYTVEHGANVIIINPQGHYVGFFKAPLDIHAMARHFDSIDYWFGEE